jgi:hypothetical protein
MSLTTRKQPRDYTGVFIAVVLSGLVVIVWGLMMASMYSMGARTRTSYLTQLSRDIAPIAPDMPNSDKAGLASGTN